MHAISQHAGQALLRTAQTYPTLLKAGVEMVQNAVDDDVLASVIDIVVDRMKRTFVVRDDGFGTTPNKFASALATVGTPFRKGKDALGQFGIGLISPLGKCKVFQFTSRPKPRKGVAKGAKYHQWTFDCDSIVSMANAVHVPFKDVVPPPEKGEETPWWSSEMRLIETTEDAAVANFTLEELVRHIVSTIGRRLRRQKTRLSIKIIEKDGTVTEDKNVKVADFSGDPIPEYTVDTEKAGKVTFRLFSRIGTKSKSPAQVLVGRAGRDERFSIRCLNLNRLMARNPSLQILQSGFFEGEILAENVELKPDRDAFRENEAFLDFGVALETWGDDVGKGLIEDAKKDTSDVRRQKLGILTMAVIEELIKQPEFAGLLRAIESATVGNVGPGHVGGKVLKDPASVIGMTLAGSKVGSGENGRPIPQRSEDPKAKEAHVPKVVVGPKGQERKFVRGHSTGLMFCHDILEHSMRPFEFELKTGMLTFNIRHPAWVLVEEQGSDNAVLELQERIAVMAMTEAIQPDIVRENARPLVDQTITTFARLIVDGRKARRKAKDGIEIE